MEKEVRCASPYAWEANESKASHLSSTKLIQGEPYIGSGFAALQHQLGSESDMNENAKLILNNLLMDHNVKLGVKNDEKKRKAQEAYGGTTRPLHRSKLPTEVVSTRDDIILGMARDGKLSVFSTILDIVGSSNQPVQTKTLIRKCCWTIKPSDLPGSIDAKEYILGALHFLSSKFESSSPERYPSLPLIYPIQLTGDIEKRNYEKFGDWKLADIQDQVLGLEQIFIFSPNSWKWMRREAFSPRLPPGEENSFFLKGVIPVQASAKKTKGEAGGRKRKSATAAASSSAGAPPEPVASATAEAD